MKKAIFFILLSLISCNSSSQKISKNEIDYIEKDKESGFFRVHNKKGKYGFIDKDSIIQIPFDYDFINPFDDNLLAFTKNNGKELYINTKGEIIIPPDYGKLNLFSEGLLSVKKNGKYGFLDTKGKVVIPFDFDGTGFFCQGLCIVSKNNQYGFINKHGEIVIPISYESVKNSHADNIVIASQKGKWGFLNSQGEQISDFIFDKVFSGYNLNIKAPSNLSEVTTYFKNGAVLVLKDNKYEFLNEKIKPAFPNNKFDSASVFDTYQNAIVKRNGKYGIIKPNGEAKVQIEYDFVEYFDSNHNSSEYYNARKGKIYSIFNKDLKKLGDSYEPVYNDYSIKTPFVIFKNLENRYGMVASTGEEIIPFDFDQIHKIERTNLLLVSQKNKFGIIDEKGKIRIPIQYKEIYPLYDKFDDDELRKKNLFIADNKIINIENQVLIDKYNSIIPIFNNHNYLIVSKNKKFGIVDVNKNIILPLEYDEISNWTEYGPRHSKFIVKNGKIGLIDHENFKITVPPIYDKFKYINGLIFAKKQNKAGIINEGGAVLCNFIYDEIYPNLSDFYAYSGKEPRIYAKKNNSYFQINAKGKILKSNLTKKFVIESSEIPVINKQKISETPLPPKPR
ncbi:KWG Leptospira [Chryseobacterium sp. MOF25P]|uniref:WG repeat-containing protein n=1 Tax=unclassified Chryseobacterium TaxID=2593645 RepID=UPI000805D8F3|nr:MULTISPECIES: WG repeat-containing protein [unclassified Chryseobacterium]OBW43252.1 KWG Leptospira [Chryseobacterium sp. MOF25P]OBW46486.1 KWG Leptospira [Chryseobacterium sp. BGARF1]